MIEALLLFKTVILTESFLNIYKLYNNIKMENLHPLVQGLIVIGIIFIIWKYLDLFKND